MRNTFLRLPAHSCAVLPSLRLVVEIDCIHAGERDLMCTIACKIKS